MKNHSDTYTDIERGLWNLKHLKTLLNILRFLSFARPHSVFLLFDHTNTYLYKASFVSFVCTDFFEILSLFHICLHTFTYQMNLSTQTHTSYWDTWCHVQLLIFITRNSRNSSNSKKNIRKIAVQSPILTVSERVPSATNNCTQFTNTSWCPNEF